MPSRVLASPDPEEEVLVYEDANTTTGGRSKRPKKATEKRAAQEEESMAAKKRRILQLQSEVNRMSRKNKADETDFDDEMEAMDSEEEAIPKKLTSSIKILPTVESRTPVAAANRAPLKRIGAAASRIPSQTPRISSNAFKTLPTPVSAAEEEHQVEHNMVDAADAAADLEEPTVSSEAPTGPSSPCATYVDRRQSSGASVTAEQPSTAKKAQPLKHANAGATPTQQPPLQTPKFRANVMPNLKKPKASDFSDIENALIIRAAAEYEALVCTKDAFPDTARRNKWAKLTWKHAGEAAGEWYELIDPINYLVRSRGSRIRGYAITCIRTIVQNMGFQKSTEPKVVAANLSLLRMLKTSSTFHYKDPETLTGFVQSKIISQVLNAVWFEDKQSLGVVFESLFNPIPLEMLALMFTIIDFCLDEWSTGRRVKATMWEKDVIEHHRVFRVNLQEWEKLNEKVVLAIRRKLYTRAARNAGVSDTSNIQQTLVGEVHNRVCNELDGQTGETDSEAEEEEGQEGGQGSEARVENAATETE